MFHIINIFDGSQSVIEGTWSLKVRQSSIPFVPPPKLQGYKYELDASPVLDGNSIWEDILE